MSTAMMVAGSAVFWVGASLVAGQPTIAAILAVGHVLFWQNHALEVRINKLLDDRGLFVGQADINQ